MTVDEIWKETFDWVKKSSTCSKSLNASVEDERNIMLSHSSLAKDRRDEGNRKTK